MLRMSGTTLLLGSRLGGLRAGPGVGPEANYEFFRPLLRGELAEDMLQVGQGIDTYAATGLGDRVQGRCRFGADFRAGEEIVLSPECNRAHRVLQEVVVYFHLAMIYIANECVPMIEGVFDRFPKCTLGKYRQIEFIEARLDGYQDRFALLFANFRSCAGPSCRSLASDSTAYSFEIQLSIFFVRLRAVFSASKNFRRA